MKKNIGKLDRVLRVILGIALLGMFTLSGDIKWLGLVGVVLLATAAVNFCPIYYTLKISSAK